LEREREREREGEGESMWHGRPEPEGRFIHSRKKISVICKILKNSEVDDYF
jgi:hypothetical protein